LIGIGLLVVVIAIDAEELFGAVYLRLINTYVGVAAGTCFLYATLLLLLWNRMSPQSRLGWGLVGLLVVTCATTISPLLTIGTWLVSLLLNDISLEILAFMLTASINLWIILSTTFFRGAESGTRLTLCGILLFTAIYSFSVAGAEQSVDVSFPTVGRLNDHTYLIYLRKRWVSSEPDTLILYKCNSVMLFCQNVYEKHDSFYTFDGLKKIELFSDASSNTMSVRIDNETIYTHVNLT
jgi:hypothetical protein